MRLLFSIIVALLVSCCLFFIVKLWGKSQLFIEYKHPFLSASDLPLEFVQPTEPWTIQDLKNKKWMNLYFNIAVTRDQKIVFLKTMLEKVRSKNWDEIKESVYTVSEMKDFLSDKRVIFNLTENPPAGHEIMAQFFSDVGFDKNRNFLITSPFEPTIKYLKNLKPTYLYGTTQPEILRIKALESIFLVEASVFRADVVIHPIDFYLEKFYSDELISELKRRHRNIIVGPLPESALLSSSEELIRIKPFGYIIQRVSAF